jgi:hypothetical protein
VRFCDEWFWWHRFRERQQGFECGTGLKTRPCVLNAMLSATVRMTPVWCAAATLYSTLPEFSAVAFPKEERAW